MKIRDLMVSCARGVHEDDDVGSALDLMRCRGVHHLPVFRFGRLVGTITDHDVLARAGKCAHVRDVMSAVPAVHVAPDDHVVDCVRRSAGMRCLPVLDGDRLVGIIDVDVLRAHAGERVGRIWNPPGTAELR